MSTDDQFIENYQGVRYASEAIDLSTFDKEAVITRLTSGENADNKVTGINVALLIFKAKIRNKVGSIYLPDQAVQTDKEYSAMVGLVIQLGPDAFKGDQFPSGPYCKVGDWVMFPRGASFQFKYEHEPLLIVEDVKIKMVITDPSKVSR